MTIVNYRPDIDGLRALAVLAVVVFHTDPSLLPGGFLGVDVFFVISGYLISLILFRQQAAGTLSFAAFYARRIRRLFPALSLVLLACLALGFFALFPDEYERLARHSAYAIVFLLNFRLLGEAGYFDVASFTKPLLHLWSLSVEEQFYVVWPVLLCVIARFRLKASGLLVVCFSLSLAYALWLGRINPDATYYQPFARFWELLLGAALAYRHLEVSTGPRWTLPGFPAMQDFMSLAGLFLVASSFLFFNKALHHPGLATLWPLVGAVLVLAGRPYVIGNRFLAWRPLVWVGLISYPLYLWHWPVLSYIRVMESGSPAPWMLWAGACCSVGLAWLTFQCVELPLRKLESGAAVVFGLCIAMVVLLAASLLIAATGGLPSRPGLQFWKLHEPQMVRDARQDAGCIGLFKQGQAPVYCRQDNPGPRMIALIGDSHAHVLFSGVSALAASRGYGTLLLANSGCPPFLGAVTGRNELEKNQCAKGIEAILQQLRGDRRVASVVIASRGPQYISGSGFGPAEANSSYPPISAGSPSNIGIESPAPLQVFADGLAATAGQFYKQGIRVSYLLQVPELGVPAKDCLGRPLSLGHQAGCVVPYGEYAERMKIYRQRLRELSREIPFLNLIDPEQVFCNTEACSGFIDNQLLYADDNHLSEAGSKRVAPLILKTALEGDGK